MGLIVNMQENPPLFFFLICYAPYDFFKFFLNMIFLIFNLTILIFKVLYLSNFLFISQLHQSHLLICDKKWIRLAHFTKFLTYLVKILQWVYLAQINSSMANLNLFLIFLLFILLLFYYYYYYQLINNSFIKLQTQKLCQT